MVDPALYINRELSWVAFNQRVLAQALSEHTPLLEQAKFSAIFSNNLDEFFMVRVASLQSQHHAGVEKLSHDGLTPLEQLGEIRRQLEPLLERQQQHYRKTLKHQLSAQGILLLDYDDLSRKQKDWARSYFQREVFPVLTPLAVDPAHRRQGLGRRVLELLLERAAAAGAAHATLEVAASNGAAVALYGRCGFSTAGVRRAYYRNGDDALVQWRRLHDAQGVRIAAHS